MSGDGRALEAAASTEPAGTGVERRGAARVRDWLGIALIIATPTVHGYTFLLMVPALVTIRRDLAIPVGALFLGTYHGFARWLAFLFVVYLLIASTRWRWLRAPRRSEASEHSSEQTAKAAGSHSEAGA